MTRQHAPRAEASHPNVPSRSRRTAPPPANASPAEDEPLELRVVRDVVQAALRQQPIEPSDGTRFTAYTDGSCLRNPAGPGGFGAVIRSQASGRTWELAGHLPTTTNNRAEWSGLMAAVLLVPAPGLLVAYTDSQYIQQVALGRWKRKANQDLWRIWDELRDGHRLDLDLRWVRGHAADPGNERADALATLAAFKFDETAWRAAREVPESVQAVRRLQALVRDDWEARFVKDVSARLQRGLRLSPKQQAILDRIAARGSQSP